MSKYMLILFTGLSLASCAQTGRLLGEITMLPVRVISGGVSYDHSEHNQDIIEIKQTYQTRTEI